MPIYAITNRINGKQYIGQTARAINNRWREHKTNARRGCGQPLYIAMREEGFENFTIEVVGDTANPAMLNDLEIMLIDLYDSVIPGGYNLKRGGCSAKHHPRTLALFAAQRNTPENRMRISVSQRGKSVSPSSRDKIRTSLKGKTPWNKGTATGGRSPSPLGQHLVRPIYQRYQDGESLCELTRIYGVSRRQLLRAFALIE